MYNALARNSHPLRGFVIPIKLSPFPTVKQFPPVAVEKLDGGALVLLHAFEAHLFRVTLMVLRL